MQNSQKDYEFVEKCRGAASAQKCNECIDPASEWVVSHGAAAREAEHHDVGDQRITIYHSAAPGDYVALCSTHAAKHHDCIARFGWERIPSHWDRSKAERARRGLRSFSGQIIASPRAPFPISSASPQGRQDGPR